MDKQKQLEARIKLSQEILVWSEGKNEIFLEMSTGVGKSFNFFNIVNEDYQGGEILCLFPETPLIESFKLDCIKLGFERLLSNMTLACYASLHKYIDINWEWACLDEGHHLTSDIRVDLINKLKYRRVVGLSATLSEENEDILFSCLPFHKFSLTTSEAVERGILPEPEVRIVSIDLDDTILRNEVKYGKKVVKVSDRGYYKKLSESITYWKNRFEDEGSPFLKNKMLAEGNNRQKFLAKCKTETAKELIKTFDTRYIVFCGSLEQAREIDAKHVVSSKTSKKVNLGMIEAFNAGKIDRLFMKNMLKEGQNLVDCPVGLVIQLNNQEKDFVQILGRLLRADNPILYILMVNDTVDTRFFNSSTKKLNKDYLTHQN